MESSALDKNRLIRFIILCHCEQLIDRSQLARALEAVHSLDAGQSDPTQALKSVLSVSKLQEIQSRLSQNLQITESLLSSSPGVEEIQRQPEPASAARSSAARAKFSADAPVLETTGSGDWNSDLHVNVMPKLLWPVVVIGIGVLLFFVYRAIPSFDTLFNGPEDTATLDPAADPSPPSNLPQSFAALPDTEPEDESPLGAAELQTTTDQDLPSVSLHKSIDNLANNRQWDAAVKLLDSSLGISQRDKTTSIREAALLLACDEPRYDDAITLLVQPYVILPADKTWQQLFATSLFRASKQTRLEIIDALESSSARARLQPTIRVLVDWVHARDGAKLDELDELRRRTASFESSTLDNFFLALANLAAKKPAQVKYHLGQATRRFDADTDDRDAAFPDWLHEVSQNAIAEALKDLGTRATDAPPTDPATTN